MGVASASATGSSAASPTTYGYGQSSNASTSKATSSPAATSSRKRKSGAADDASQAESLKKKPRKEAGGEKRLRRFRPKAPQNFHEIYNRALTQRFYVLERRRGGTAEAPEEEVELTGSTGNLYTVKIAQRPSCTCPHFLNGNQCKHWLYVMSRVLRAKFEHTYQLALLTSELKEIFANAPPIDNPSDSTSEASRDKNRKPIEDDCPICFCELEAESKESIVWCRAACGQNIHKECFETWAATKRNGHGGGEVTCPFCRSVWQGDEDMVANIKRGGAPTHEGYVNVADQLGISTHRDHSTYSRWWRGPSHR